MTRFTQQQGLNRRIAWLLENVWQGNRTEMARACGVTPAAISLICAGKRSPGGKLLERLARHEGVNAAWLITGAGPQLIPSGPSIPAGHLPVARQLLPGPPKQHPALLSPDVVRDLFELGSGGYVYRLTTIDGLVQSSTGRASPGDLLFIDTAPATIRSGLSFTYELGVVLLPGVPDEHPHLARFCLEANGQTVVEVILPTIAGVEQVTLRRYGSKGEWRLDSRIVSPEAGRVQRSRDRKRRVGIEKVVGLVKRLVREDV